MRNLNQLNRLHEINEAKKTTLSRKLGIAVSHEEKCKRELQQFFAELEVHNQNTIDEIASRLNTALETESSVAAISRLTAFQAGRHEGEAALKIGLSHKKDELQRAKFDREEREAEYRKQYKKLEKHNRLLQRLRSENTAFLENEEDEELTELSLIQHSNTRGPFDE